MPAKKFDIPNVETKDPTPNRFANITDVKEFPGAVENPKIKPSIAKEANVWQYIIANAEIAATVLAIIRTTIGLTEGRSAIPPNRILANVLAPPMIDTM